MTAGGARALRALEEYRGAKRREKPETTLAGVCNGCGESLAIVHIYDTCGACGQWCCRAGMQTLRIPGESVDVCAACYSAHEDSEEP